MTSVRLHRTAEEFQQVRDLLDIEDEWADYGYVGPADVRRVTLNGKPWGATPYGVAWMSKHPLVVELIIDEKPPAKADGIMDDLSGGSPIKFTVGDAAFGAVAVCGGWYNPRRLAGLVALHGTPTHSVPMKEHSTLVWRHGRHVQAALMPLKTDSVGGRDFLADLYRRWPEGATRGLFAGGAR